MTDIGIVGLILIGINLIVSYQGFKDNLFFDKYKFEVDGILLDKDYKRFITSGFLHVNWMHLIFNMMSLYAFSGSLEFQIGGLYFLIIYLVSLVGGDILALFIHRNHGDYSSVGASGAICGVIFASIALFPGIEIGFWGLPFSIPSWLYGLLYVMYSIYGIKSNKDNVGHESHLGGALIGMIVAIIIQPNALIQNYLPILLVIVPTVVFIYIIVTRPHILLIDNYFHKTHSQYFDIEDKYNDQRANRQKELDRLLDKINQKGIESLTQKEKKRLKEYSK